MAKSQALRQEKINLDEIIGINIRNERQNRDFSRDELAEMLDLTPSHMGLIERGERGATAVTLSKISRVLGLSIDSLFTARGITNLREERADAKSTYHKKINSIISNLDEEKLAFLVYFIQGLNKLPAKRKK